MKMDRSQWHFRPNTQDEFIYNEVYVENCYRLPDDMSGVVVIDVGANTGAFAVACLERGAERVICFEPDFHSYQILVKNHLIRFEQGRWTAIQAAIAGEFRRHSDVFLSPLEKRDDQVLMTGGRHITSDKGEQVSAAFLTDFLRNRDDRVWLKLDCEGSEHEILADNLPWGRIDRIFGEIHDCAAGANADSLVKRLAEVGYQVELVANPEDPHLSLFFAAHKKGEWIDISTHADKPNSKKLFVSEDKLPRDLPESMMGLEPIDYVTVKPEQKTVCILTPFRNARRYLPLYFSQMSSLQSLLQSEGYRMRIVAAEGDSLDGTRERIDQLAAEYDLSVKIVDTTHGLMKWASVEDPIRLKTMSDVMNKSLDQVQDSDDIVVWIMSDLKWEPKTILSLIYLAMDQNRFGIIAPAVYSDKDKKYFYDTWAFRHTDGTRFEPTENLFWDIGSGVSLSVARSDIEYIKSAGTCLVMPSCVARECRATDNEAVSFCSDAKSKGYATGINRFLIVLHAPLPAKRLLWISDAVCISGFSRVAHAMFPLLVEAGYDLDIIALNYFGEPHNFPYTIYPASVQGEDLSGNLRAKYLIYQAHQDHRPFDLIVKLDDPWNIKGLTLALESLEREYKILTPKVLAWVTVDGKNANGKELNSDCISRLLCCSEFGSSELALQGYKDYYSIGIVTFGVDTSIFKPIDKVQARSLVSSQEIPSDAFIVGVVSTNQLRKRLDLVLAYFSAWTTQYNVSNAYLYLCLGPDHNSGFDINSLKDYYGLKNRIIWNPHKLTDQALALVYNSFDVYMSLSQGEGFGLCTLEAMACGVPCVLTDWAAYSSWVPESVAYKIPCTSTAVNSPLNVKSYVMGGVADQAETIGALQKLYLYPELREKMGKAGVEFAQGMTWKQTGDKLIKEIEQVISRVKRSPMMARAEMEGIR